MQPIRTVQLCSAFLLAGVLAACGESGETVSGATAGTWRVELTQSEGAGCGSDGAEIVLVLNGATGAEAGRVQSARLLALGPASSVALGLGEGTIAVTVNDYDSADALVLIGTAREDAFAGTYSYRGEGCLTNERGTFLMRR